MATKREIFANNLRKAVAASYYNQAQLAEVCGVSRGSFSDWCSGKTYPRPEKMQVLCKALGVSEYDLTTDIDSAPVTAFINSDVVKIAKGLLANPDARALYSEITKLRTEDFIAVKQLVNSLPKRN